jgi:gamma-aminobutyric acid type B receptor
MKLCFRLLLLNGTILAIWTIVDPLKWERVEVDGGMIFEDGTVETYGTCKGEDYVASLSFPLILFALNMTIATIATRQAFKCRFLVLEYNEMQWLLLSLFPFVEVWLIGGPLVGLSYDEPTIQFVVLSMMITASTLAAALSVFAPKDWYMRKFKDIDAALDVNAHRRTSSAGILVLKHPTVS